jgi:hypothetical protein
VAYYLKAGLGLILAVAGFVAFERALYEFIQIGTCASGTTPYEIARPCPEGTGKWFAVIFLGIPVALIGLAMFVFRGDAPGGRDDSAPPWLRPLLSGAGLFSIFFGVTALVALWATYGPDAEPGPGAELGVTIMSVTFLLMALGPLALKIWLRD